MQEAKIYNQMDDEIDLRELWKTIVKRKKMIVLVTGLVTCGAIIYALVKTPIYEVKAVVDIGSYSNVLLEPSVTLVKKVEVKYIDNRDKEKKTELTKVSLLKGSTDLVELVVSAPSNEEAIQEVSTIVNEIKQRHEERLEDYLSLIHQKIDNLQGQKDELEGEKKELNDFIIHKTHSIDKILKDNPAVAAVYTIELNSKASELSDLKQKIYTINNQLNDLFLTLSPNNIQHTDMLGKVTQNKYPIKPRKTLIVAVAMVTGLILSIFLAFFLEFIGKNEHE